MLPDATKGKAISWIPKNLAGPIVTSVTRKRSCQVNPPPFPRSADMTLINEQQYSRVLSIREMRLRMRG